MTANFGRWFRIGPMHPDRANCGFAREVVREGSERFREMRAHVKYERKELEELSKTEVIVLALEGRLHG